MVLEWSAPSSRSSPSSQNLDQPHDCSKLTSYGKLAMWALSISGWSSLRCRGHCATSQSTAANATTNPEKSGVETIRIVEFGPCLWHLWIWCIMVSKNMGCTDCPNPLQIALSARRHLETRISSVLSMSTQYVWCTMNIAKYLIQSDQILSTVIKSSSLWSYPMKNLSICLSIDLAKKALHAAKLY